MRAGTFQDITLDDGTSMRMFVARPESPRPHAGILLIQEAFGVNDHIRDLCGRFAGEGYLVVAPEMFHRTAPGLETGYTDFSIVKPHMDALTVPGMSADLRAAHGWLVAEGKVDPARIAAVGYCMGGRAAFLANLTLPLAAAVSYYGGGIVATGLIQRAAELHAHHLFFWGGKDKNIPPEQHRAIDDALRAAGKPFTTVEFADADHGFNCDQRSQYQPAAAVEAWALTRAFLQVRLAS